jgi:hypothetical protein
LAAKPTPAAPAAFTFEATPMLLFRAWPPAVAMGSGRFDPSPTPPWNHAICAQRMAGVDVEGTLLIAGRRRGVLPSNVVAQRQDPPGAILLLVEDRHLAAGMKPDRLLQTATNTPT